MCCKKDILKFFAIDPLSRRPARLLIFPLFKLRFVQLSLVLHLRGRDEGWDGPRARAAFVAFAGAAVFATLAAAMGVMVAVYRPFA